MRTSLELATELDALLKRSKPFRNFQEVFTLTEQLISSLNPQPVAKKSTPVIEDAVIVEDTAVEETVETKVVKKTTKK
jgi:hypothetical protein